MSQYNKTVLTNAGLELAKRANAGQAKFEITRAVTSADDWSNKTIQDLEAVTTIPNIMQQGNIIDTEEVESNNSVIGVSLCFANKDLSTGYQIRIIGLYVKEEGQENDFLYAVTTAVTPEYMPDFNDKVLYRFNMQMYLVIGKAQAVNVVINDGSSVTHGQLDKYKSEVTANLKKIENTHKEDMSHVVKGASVNGGDDILPDETGKLELVVPDPDLSKYVSLEQLTETLKTKADITAIPDKTATEEGIRQAKQMAQEADTKAQSALDTKADKTTVEENLATKANQSDLDQTNAEVAKKANKTDISDLQSKITNAQNTATQANNNANTRLPLTGGAMNSNAEISFNNDAVGKQGGLTWNGSTDSAKIYGDVTAQDNLDLAFDLGDDGSNHFSFRQNGSETSAITSDGHYTGTVDWGHVNGRPQDQINRINVEGPLFKRLTQFNNWGDLFDGYSVNGFTATNSNRLVAFRDETNGGNTVGNNGAGIGFGGSDTKGVLSVAYNNHQARITGGNGSGPVWSEDIAWKSDVNDLRNQVQQLKDNQFEVQTFTDATAAASWEAQRQGKRMAIVNK